MPAVRVSPTFLGPNVPTSRTSAVKLELLILVAHRRYRYRSEGILRHRYNTSLVIKSVPRLQSSPYHQYLKGRLPGFLN